jgi:hypothetical protein
LNLRVTRGAAAADAEDVALYRRIPTDFSASGHWPDNDAMQKI